MNTIKHMIKIERKLVYRAACQRHQINYESIQINGTEKFLHTGQRVCCEWESPYRRLLSEVEEDINQHLHEWHANEKII